MRFLQTELKELNPFVQIFQSARQQFQVNSNSNLRLKISSIHSQDIRTYNTPTASEIAAIINDDDEINSGRDIILTTQQVYLQYITELHGAYDPLQYLLLFSRGEYGWHTDILQTIITNNNTNKLEESLQLNPNHS
ncbi:19050_t:CDS:1 [Dentiscutata erythropus]|uniref:19050_t:CDS:1 n=1 Tax=Dentiscutata erythropus TaxID=1348616 RepID=A0A9N9I1U4_9GLOM|nr:19050_t:CDS:1 [Dentiscutata erythropus]